MSNFLEGDRVAARAYLVREQADLEGRAGTVAAPLNGKVSVLWDGEEQPRHHVKSSLKLIEHGTRNDLDRIGTTGEWTEGADERLIAHPAGSVPLDSLDLPGFPGWYDVEFASGLVRRQFGRTQLDAARIASQLRDRELKPAKQEGEAAPHDRVKRTVYLGTTDPGPRIEVDEEAS